MSVSQSHIAEQPVGYAAHDPGSHETSPAHDHGTLSSRVGRPLAYGLLGALALATLYLGIGALAESWTHAWDLFLEDAPFVVPIVLGFGTQVGLFSYLKRVLRPAGSLGASGALAGTSGTASALGMVACCAHHVTDVLPLLGLSGAAVFLARYKALFMVLGLLSNGIGVGVLAIRIRKANRTTSSEGVCH